MSIQLHFAFPDRVLHYDCARCTALCCRGHGFGAHRRELVPLLRKAPELASWATTRNRELVMFTNPGQCYFLDARDRCSVEGELGRAAKPSMCKAFPFNRVAMLGERHVVTPNYLCPLTLEPASEANAGQHALIEAELAEDGWLEQDFPRLPQNGSESPGEFLRVESAFRDACAAALAAGGSLAPICEQTAGAGEGVAELAGWLECEAADATRFEAHFLALAPTFSFDMSRLPLRARRRALLLARLHMSRALSLPGAAATLQMMNGLFVAHVALYELLAQSEQPMPAGLLIDSGDGPTLLAAAVIDRLAHTGASVHEALREGCEGLSLLERQTLLGSLGTLLRKRAFKADSD